MVASSRSWISMRERLELAHASPNGSSRSPGSAGASRLRPIGVDVLAGSDFIVNTVEVAGLANVRHDYDIPLKYGVDQCIGDTIGPGGIFKALRTGPAWLDILRDCERLCPDAWVLNYTNPMSILTLAALTGTTMRTVGLCHSVQGTSRQLAALSRRAVSRSWSGAAPASTTMPGSPMLRHEGEDMYPRLRERAGNPEIYEQDPVRFEMMLHFGAFVTESSGHFSEYVPYFRKRPDLIERYIRGGYRGESGFYANNWPAWRSENDERIRAMLDGTTEIPLERSHEYASYIVEAMRLDRPAGHLWQRAQHRADRQSAGRLRRGGLPGGSQRRAALPLRPPARAARRAQPRPYGRPYADGAGAAAKRPAGGQLRPAARSAHRGGVLAGRDRRHVRRDVGSTVGISTAFS